MDNTKTETTTESDITRITITLPTNAYFMSGIRDFTLSLIKNMTDFSEQWAYRFQSVVDELCNNAIEHGSAKKNEEIKIIFLTKERKYVEIMVEDSGTGPKKMTALELSKLVDQRKNQDYTEIGIRGRGLAKIVAEWTDELKFEDIENGGIRVRIKKFLNDPELEKDASQLQGQQVVTGRGPIGPTEKIVLET